MIFLYPALVLAAVAIVLGEERDGGHGWRWFLGWCAAGALLFFSFLTGLSIGLLLLPLAAGVLLLVALHAPHAAESSGFLAGVGLVATIVAALSWGEGHMSSGKWLVSGVMLAVAASTLYALAREHSAADDHLAVTER